MTRKRRARQLFPEARDAFTNLPYNMMIYWGFLRGNGQVGIQSRCLVVDGTCVVALDHATHQPYVIKCLRNTALGKIETVEFPCGGLEEGEDSLQGGLRELLEETGVVPTAQAQIFTLFTRKNPIIGPIITLQYGFLVTSARIEHPPKDKEADSCFTMPLSEIIRRRHDPEHIDPLVTTLPAMLAQLELTERGLTHLLT